MADFQPDVQAAVQELRDLLTPLADPGRAPQMRAYMKEVAPYLGIPTPARRAAIRPWVRRFAALDSAGLTELAAAVVAEPEREFAYSALDLLERHRPRLACDALLPLRALALTVPWGDTVDGYATLLGRTALRWRAWDPIIAGWAVDEHLWARRLALVFQVGRRDAVDLDLLWAVCTANLGDSDFFMRKGIGWALRDAARTYPDQVRAYVEANREQLSPLSIREALKHLH